MAADDVIFQLADEFISQPFVETVCVLSLLDNQAVLCRLT
jgi:hypothetical protein